MRILVVHPGADFSVDDVHRGWCKAFRNLGCEVAEFNLNDRLAFYASSTIEGKHLDPSTAARMAARGLHANLYEWWPDLVFVISAFYVLPITWDLLRGRPHRTAVLFTESPYEDDRQLRIVEYAEPDLVLVNDPVNIERYDAMTGNAHYFGHAYDPDIHHPGRGETNDGDFGFVGTGYASRVEFFEAVAWGDLDVRFAGCWQKLAADSPLRRYLLHADDECYANPLAANLYRGVRMSANLYRGGSDSEANAPELRHGWSVGPREIELAACRTFFLRESRAEGDELFRTLPTFSEPDEFSDLLRYWLAHPARREHAAEVARNAIVDRTFDASARRLLSLL